MSTEENARLRIGDRLTFFVMSQVILAVCAIGFALLPFLAIWFIGTLVDHNTSYLAGLSLYAVAATLILFLDWCRRLAQGTATQPRHSPAEKAIGFAASFTLPVVMYLCSQSVHWANGNGPTVSVWEWLRVYVNMHLDVVTVGLYNTLVAEKFSFIDDSWVARTAFFFTRALYTIGVVALVGKSLLDGQAHEANLRRRLRGQLALLVVFMCFAVIYNLLIVACTAGVSILPGRVGLLAALALPVLWQLVAILAAFPAVHAARSAARRTMSMSNLRNIGSALIGFEAEHGAFPPQCIQGADGRPLLSWRVQLLPRLGQEPLFARFRLDEPWDSEHNLRLLPFMPRVFQDPGEKTEGKTRYLAVVPANPSSHPLGSVGVPPHNALAIEAKEAHPWTAPGDWELPAAESWDDLLFRNGSALAVTAAGEVLALRPDVREKPQKAFEESNFPKS